MWVLGVGALAFAAVIAGGAKAQTEAFTDRFDSLDRSVWHVADYQWSHPLFDTDWVASHAKSGQGLALNLTPSTSAENRFDGASVRRRVASGYGRYSVRLQPAKTSGVVTGFFVYTGAHFGTLHNEIDIEFLGHDTTKINLSVFADGVRWSRQIPLGFDAASSMNSFGFDWTSDAIRWLVGDQEVLRYRKSDGNIPEPKAYIYGNIWAVDTQLTDWAGYALDGTRASAVFSCIGYTPDLAETRNDVNQCAQPKSQGPLARIGVRSTAGGAS